MNIGSLNKETLINIGIVLVILYLCFNDKFEHFGSYKASCDNLPKAVKYALEQRKIKLVMIHGIIIFHVDTLDVKQILKHLII